MLSSSLRMRSSSQQWLHTSPSRPGLAWTRLRRVQTAGLLSSRAALQAKTVLPLTRSTSSWAIPRTQKAAIVPSTGADLRIVDDHPVPQPADLKPGECLVKLDCTGVCHTDLHAARGDWPVPAKTPLVGGHEVYPSHIESELQLTFHTGRWHHCCYWRTH